jgi:NADPH:quinone reductase-like Zn-dependent oxidoreductase
MPAWSWWVIWSILIIGGAAYLGLIIFDLAAKAKRAIPVIEKSTKQIEELSESLSKSVVLAEFQGNLLDEPGPLAAEYARNQKKRESKRLSEQRRLINKLIDYKADESEFRP